MDDTTSTSVLPPVGAPPAPAATAAPPAAATAHPIEIDFSEIIDHVKAKLIADMSALRQLLVNEPRNFVEQSRLLRAVQAGVSSIDLMSTAWTATQHVAGKIEAAIEKEVKTAGFDIEGGMSRLLHGLNKNVINNAAATAPKSST